MLSNGLFLIVLSLLALAMLAGLGGILYFAMKGNAGKTGQKPPRTVTLRQESLRASFREAVALIEANIAARNERYTIPWVLVLNEGEDATRLPVAQSGVSSMLGTEAASAASTQGITWAFFDRGIVIDIQGAYLGSPDDDRTEKPWDAFLGMCRTYRPQRPFDSLVLTLPAALLLDDSVDARLEVTRRAKLAHRRLWLAQNRFAMRFAVYLVICECEHVPGLATFARALPDGMRASMLGWSSPYDLDSQYQTDRIDTAFDGILHTVSDISAEALALDVSPEQANAICMLPARIDAMRGQVRLYTDELMRPSAYHEPFLLRGLYLTGDCSESLARAAALDDDARRQASTAPQVEADWREPTFTVPLGNTDAAKTDEAPAAPSATVDDAVARAATRQDLLGQLSLQPAFLRDLFERKIFEERGLTRPSRTQQLRHPALRRGLRWGTLALLVTWGAGIVFAGAQLHGRGAQWVEALRQLHRNGMMPAAMPQDGTPLSTDGERHGALTLLRLNERFTPVTAAYIFMPGAWPLFDDLQHRVRDAFERTFGEAAVTLVRREFMARVAALTGTDRDPSTGQLVIGADCRPPVIPNNALGRHIGLNVDNQPEMTALQSYVASVDQLKAALDALQRLRRASTSRPEDLRIVIGYTLGVQPQGEITRSLPYFYQHATEIDTLLGTDVPVMRAAVRCTLDKGNARLDKRLFNDNPLLQADRVVSDGLNGIMLRGAGTSSTALLQRYAQIVVGIQEESDLVASGGGAWIRPDGPSLGSGYDRLVAHVAHNALLGQEASERMRADTQTALSAFRAITAQHFDAPDSGVRWQAKENRFALSPERAALREALTNLINQPFMQPSQGRTLPTEAPGTVLTWDETQLDQIIALADLRKRYLTEGLAHIAPNILPALQTAIDAQFAASAMDQLAGAASATPIAPGNDADATAFQAALPRLLHIAGFLDALSARPQADAVRAMVSSDALQHLRTVDTALTASELYAASRIAPPQEGVSAQTILMYTFGVRDAAGLAAYLGQQSARAQALGQQAEIYLAALTPADAVSPTAVRWQAITRDIGRYKLKNPNSSLLGIEQFLMRFAGAPGGGAAVAAPAGPPSARGSNCMDRLEGSVPTLDGDYFSEIYQRLWLQLSNRCTQQQAQSNRKQWEAFATTFNQQVAGMAPFGALGTKPADLGQVAEVMARWRDAASALLARQTAGAVDTDNGGPAVRRFTLQMEAVRRFLSPLLPHTAEANPTDGVDGTAPGDIPGYDLHLSFRTNRDEESEGNQIIDWSLQSGTQIVHASETPHPVRWTPGMPLTLALRIAKNALFIAQPDDAQMAMDTDGRTIRYRFSDPWALMTMIQTLRVAEPGLGDTPRAVTLQLSFPMGAAPQPVAPNTRKTPAPSDAIARNAARRQATVFVQIQITPAAKQNTLPWPGVFPRQAPSWHGARVD
ncbi:type VI secretion system protein [Robbsia andropogonis]|uniref:type VI secretion system protein n=1 Tax=Robbsia andropogonis TaxID=28092 RepID=UPI0020A0CB81|nr:type VI secretion system protein [Robbsia andropogonis]MCP1118032.1 type VI secretion system protein [Robbsia andropogonis]MCP1127687.1 type VI secretion system protein [Robbsia andropogonis]